MKKFLTLIALTLALCLNASAQSTGKVSLAWDPSPDTRVTAYRLYYGTSAASLTQTFDVNSIPLPSTATVTGLVNGQTYYFAVTAVDVADGLESIFSNVVNTPIPLVPLPQVTGLKIISAVAK